MEYLFDWKRYLNLHIKYCFSKATSNIIGIDVRVYLNIKYPLEFGYDFYNEWSKNLYKNEKQRHIIECIFSLNDNQTINNLINSPFQKYVSNDIKEIGGKIRLSCFYKTTLYESNIDIFNDKITTKERLFFKRLGQNILKYVIQEIMPMVDMNEYIVVEASGGKQIEDMMNLDKYYRSLGFTPASLNKKYIDYAYKKAHLVMYSKLATLF